MNKDSEVSRWFISSIIVFVLMVIVYVIMPIGFDTNDDSGMMYILAGYRTGKPAVGTVYSNIIWDYIISSLYKMYSGIQWYAVIFVFLLFLSNVIILKSILRITRYKSWAMWKGIAVYILFFIIYISYSVILLQFTTLPAILGTAACALITASSLKVSKMAYNVDMLLIAALNVLSYIIRAKAGYVVFIWCFAAVIIKLFMMKKSGEKIRKTAVKYVSVFMSIGILSGSALLVHNYFYSSESWTEYREYSAQRGKYKDYPHFTYQEADNLYEKLGWSQELYELAEVWFFMDAAVNKESFQKLNETFVSDVTMSLRIKNAFYMFGEFLRNNQIASINLIGAIMIGVLTVVESIRKRRYEHMGVLCICYLLLGLLVFYLGFSGRLPLRVFQLCILPGVSILLFNLLLVYESLDCRRRRVIAALTAALLLGAINFKNLYTVVHSPQRTESIENKIVLENYFVKHSQNIYVYDNSIKWLCDPLLKSQIVIPNNYFFWGGASMFSPLYQEQLELNGRESLYADSLFEENIYFVTKSDMYTSMVTDYLDKTYNCKTSYEKVDTVNGCSVLKFSNGK